MKFTSPKIFDLISKLLLLAIPLILLYNQLFSAEKLSFDKNIQIVALLVAFLAVDQLIALRKAVQNSKRENG